MDKKEFITYEQAVDMLPEGDEIHTFRSSSFALIGADWSRDSILESLKKYEDTIELAGHSVTGMGHGLAFKDDAGYVFIQTREQEEILEPDTNDPSQFPACGDDMVG